MGCLNLQIRADKGNGSGTRLTVSPGDRGIDVGEIPGHISLAKSRDLAGKGHTCRGADRSNRYSQQGTTFQGFHFGDAGQAREE